MTFGWLSTWTIGMVTSGSLLLLWLSGVVSRMEGRWSRRTFMSRPKSFKLPYEDHVDAWLKYCHVKMNAKQWYGLIVGSLIFFSLFGVFMPSDGITGEIAGLYFAGSVIMYPLQKRRKYNLEMEQQVQRTKRMLAKLYARSVHTDQMLPIIADALEDGEFKHYMSQALKRTKTSDTLGEAIQWMSDEIQLPSLQSLAAILVQGSKYANLPLDERLANMAAKDRDRAIINHEKLADGKRLRALVEAGSFIALPLIAFLTALVFEFVFTKFGAVHL